MANINKFFSAEKASSIFSEILDSDFLFNVLMPDIPPKAIAGVLPTLNSKLPSATYEQKERCF